MTYSGGSCFADEERQFTDLRGQRQARERRVRLLLLLNRRHFVHFRSMHDIFIDSFRQHKLHSHHIYATFTRENLIKNKKLFMTSEKHSVMMSILCTTCL